MVKLSVNYTVFFEVRLTYSWWYVQLSTVSNEIYFFMPTKEMFRFKVCRQVSVPIWSVEIRLFCIASQRVEEKSTISKLVWCWPPYRKALAVRKGLLNILRVIYNVYIILLHPICQV